MSQSEIESMLNRIMDQIPEVEGIIAADGNGKKISGQTITEMDHDKIIKAVLTTFKASQELGTVVEKGEATEVRVNSKDGYTMIVGSKKLILIAITALDAVNSVSLIVRNLHMILEQFG
ncbi:MAG TPA: roadblock/LC7 domain-containing protein [Candidatus Deferrimicrobium sp.]|nr:roadblock/LC7 domain-containing protein [Candidatus Deferrimicrobium sp.]